MLGPVEIGLIIGIVTLFTERMFVWMARIKKSSCLGFNYEREVSKNELK